MRKASATEIAAESIGHALLLTIQQVATLTSLSVPTIRRWSRSGAFPEPRNIATTIVRWRREDVVAFADGTWKRKEPTGECKSPVGKCVATTTEGQQ